MIYLRRGTNIPLSENLDQSEVDCRCSYGDCTSTMIHHNTINCFQKIRDEYGYRIIVTSGYRCAKHNKDVGGIPTSKHPMGFAIDIRAENLEELYDISRQYFDTVIKYDTFLHCHSVISPKS